MKRKTFSEKSMSTRIFSPPFIVRTLKLTILRKILSFLWNIFVKSLSATFYFEFSLFQPELGSWLKMILTENKGVKIENI